eukprot:GHVP01035298.1.p1 GENE.GHVP01035298.1~~GHVP01035298.1.p1  ORF type:complete len:274 (+),score=41.85 GHVP01035298.1:324-1145(+)
MDPRSISKIVDFTTSIDIELDNKTTSGGWSYSIKFFDERKTEICKIQVPKKRLDLRGQNIWTTINNWDANIYFDDIWRKLTISNSTILENLFFEIFSFFEMFSGKLRIADETATFYDFPTKKGKGLFWADKNFYARTQYRMKCREALYSDFSFVIVEDSLEEMKLPKDIIEEATFWRSLDFGNEPEQGEEFTKWTYEFHVGSQHFHIFKFTAITPQGPKTCIYWRDPSHQNFFYEIKLQKDIKETVTALEAKMKQKSPQQPENDLFPILSFLD